MKRLTVNAEKRRVLIDTLNFFINQHGFEELEDLHIAADIRDFLSALCIHGPDVLDHQYVLTGKLCKLCRGRRSLELRVRSRYDE